MKTSMGESVVFVEAPARLHFGVWISAEDWVDGLAVSGPERGTHAPPLCELVGARGGQWSRRRSGGRLRTPVPGSLSDSKRCAAASRTCPSATRRTQARARSSRLRWRRRSRNFTPSRLTRPSSRAPSAGRVARPSARGRSPVAAWSSREADAETVKVAGRFLPASPSRPHGDA